MFVLVKNYTWTELTSILREAEITNLPLEINQIRKLVVDIHFLSVSHKRSFLRTYYRQVLHYQSFAYIPVLLLVLLTKYSLL